MHVKHFLSITLFSFALPIYVIADECDPNNQTLPSDYKDTWYLFVDNDKRASLLDKDQNYTSGLSIARVSDSFADSKFYFERSLAWLGKLLPIPEAIHFTVKSRSMEVGVSAFTPQDIESSEPVYYDPPYASVVFWTQSNKKYIVSQHNNNLPTSIYKEMVIPLYTLADWNIRYPAPIFLNPRSFEYAISKECF